MRRFTLNSPSNATALHKPERRFLTGSSRTHTLGRLETGAPSPSVQERTARTRSRNRLFLLGRLPSCLQLLSLLLGSAAAVAGSSSARYTILHDALNAGGGSFRTGAYTVDASLDGFGGVASTSFPTWNVRVGFPGQINTPPQAQDGQTFVSRGSIVALTLAATDPDRDSLSFRIVSGPALGSVTGTLPTVIYRPGPAFESVDFFNYVASDGTEDSAPATIRFLLGGNSAPSLEAVPNQFINEEQLLTIQLLASDPDLPNEVLRFSLDANAPSGASVDPLTGLLTWRPGETHGSSVFPFTVRVQDDGEPSFGAIQRFSVTVAEVNQPPVFPPVPPLTARPSIEFHRVMQGQDSDAPAQRLFHRLGTGAPAGVAIHESTGELTWTPGTDLIGKSFIFDVVVSDDGTPPLSASQAITIQVQPLPNTAPTLNPITDRTVAEETLLSIPISAVDLDLPAQTLTYSLDPSPVAGAALDPITLRFRWTPNETQGPGSYRFTVRVTDDGNPTLSDAHSFNITVTESNSPPVLGTLNDQSVLTGGTLTFTASATDSDLPAQRLTFALSRAPAGATLNPLSGAFRWSPGNNQPIGPVTVEITVRDDGFPIAAATAAIRVNVLPPAGWTELIRTAQDELRFSYQGLPQACYRLETSSDLVLWMPKETRQADSNGRLTVIEARDANATIRLYRLVPIPCG